MRSCRLSIAVFLCGLVVPSHAQSPAQSEASAKPGTRLESPIRPGAVTPKDATVKKSSPKGAVEIPPLKKLKRGKSVELPPLKPAKRVESITIDPATLRRLEPAEPATELDGIVNAYEAFKSARTSFMRSIQQYRRKVRECGAKSYSARDQESAGCRPDDTVAQCSEKLIGSCSLSSRTNHMRARRSLMLRASALETSVDRLTSAYVR